MTNGIYHVFNRGVAKQDIFHDTKDYQQFLQAISYYLESKPLQKFSAAKQSQSKEQLLSDLQKTVHIPLVKIHAYCLMPNHFHLLLEQKADHGISIFMRRSLLSYTRFYNTRYDRIGPIFQGTFKAIGIDSNEQLLHVSRYIHLNPFVAHLVESAEKYLWSSLKTFYLDNKKSRLCDPSLILNLIKGRDDYRKFIEDYAGYARDISSMKKLLLDV